jgi:proteasome lid subunit RPN8/RPN11
LSYVSIWKPVNDRIVKASRGTKNEIIGLLIGRLQDDAIIIEESVTGEFSAEPHRVTLPSSALAKIADALVTGRLKGNIVGWYHSHTEGGLFFSETDIATQKKLQQFSSLITGMVVDAQTGEVGYFRADPATGKALRLPGEKIRVYTELSEAIPPEAKAKPTKPRIPTPTVEVRRTVGEPWQPTSRLILSVLLIALLASLAVIGVILYRGASPALTISHTPIPTATVGSPIDVRANITGPVHNVTLAYASTGTGPFVPVLMNAIAPGEYGYTIPGVQVTGNIAYYIVAADTAGNKVSTSTYYIAVADFKILPQSTTLTIYRNSTNPFVSELGLLLINSFAQPLLFSASGAPQGMEVTFSPNPAPAGTTKVEMTIAATPNAPNGTASVSISAAYTPPGLPAVTRQTTITITVADYDLQVTPRSSDLSAGSSTTLTLTLTLEKGFVDPVTINVLGLPPGAKWQLSTNNATVLGGGAGTATRTLQITIATFTKPGTYGIVVSATGAGVVHSRTVQLTVR